MLVFDEFIVVVFEYLLIMRDFRLQVRGVESCKDAKLFHPLSQMRPMGLAYVPTKLGSFGGKCR